MTFETVDKVRAELSALTLDLEQAAITIAAKAGAARALRDHALDALTTLAADEPHARVPMEVWPIASEPESAHDPAAKFDALLHAVTPAYCVPVHGAFERMTDNGHRYLVAADGLWLEVHRPWLHLLWPLANIGEPVKAVPGFRTHHATPFGHLNPVVELAFGKVPQDLIRSFAERGRTSCPNERGAWLSWEHGIEGTEPRLVWSEAVDSEGTPGELHYARPEHHGQLSPCIDLHTHGTAPAFFSATDDQDDAHDVKIAIVIGNLDQPIPTIAARLCCLGVFIPVTVRAEEIFGGAA